MKIKCGDEKFFNLVKWSPPPPPTPSYPKLNLKKHPRCVIFMASLVISRTVGSASLKQGIFTAAFRDSLYICLN